MPIVWGLEGWFFLSAALLLVSGGAKLADPAPTSGALRVAGLVSGSGVVYTLAVAEIATGAFSLLAGGALAGWVMAVLYGGFGWFVAFALRRHIPISSCGCFGKVDTPPSIVHLFLNAAGLAAGVWAALTQSPSLVSVLGEQPVAGLAYLAFLAAGTYAAYLLLTALPVLLKPHLARHP
ncbi:MAG TPA: MauE/DoxX family redox-associated membrane protein [Acidimicrobiia bacterium]|nr:MauE/DoxX family redox-associated membrane protein [Acidimicrobiia bacterium]